MKKINVLVVDDSAVARQVVTQILSEDSAINVLGAAQDPLFAMERMKKVWPDVLVLDIEMPRMDGLTFLRKIMEERPTPVVICSTLTEKGAKVSIDAMAAGAVGVVTKARSGLSRFLEEHAAELIAAVKAAAQVNVSRLRSRPAPLETAPKVERKLTADAILTRSTSHHTLETTERIVAIGTSTGGTLALEEVLVRLGQMAPGIVVVQHMPERFTAAFAERLNGLCKIEVREARNGDRVLPGLALIAPGGRHMLLKSCGAHYQVEVLDGPVVNRHRPSVDVLFRSVAKYAGKNALGIIMTGMGDDGAAGLLEMRQAGAQTIAQDEASCVVYGMPKEAVRRGGAMAILPLNALPQEISRFGGNFM